MYLDIHMNFWHLLPVSVMTGSSFPAAHKCAGAGAPYLGVLLRRVKESISEYFPETRAAGFHTGSPLSRIFHGSNVYQFLLGLTI